MKKKELLKILCTFICTKQFYFYNRLYMSENIQLEKYLVKYLLIKFASLMKLDMATRLIYLSYYVAINPYH